MGYVRHNAIVATTWQQNAASELVNFAESIGAQAVSVTAMVNDYTTVMVAPDGSKEGWQDSDFGDERRRKIKEWLVSAGNAPNGLYFEWVEVAYGDDDASASIVADRWHV